MKRRLLNICLALVAFLFSAELLSIGWYWHSHHEFFYKRIRKKEIKSEETKLNDLPVLRFHPFFGFVDRTNLNVVNNQGFYSSYNFPYSKRKPNEYIIAITGGSVAARVELTGAKQRIVDVLKQSPYFRNKPITVINFGMGAYKQPQQLIALAYFLSIGQQIDLLVNIDGLNEVALSSINYHQSVDMFMPSADIMRPLLNLANQTFLSTEDLQTLAKIAQYKSQLVQIRSKLSQSRVASNYFILEQWERLLQKKYHRQIELLTKSQYKEIAESIIYVPPMNGRMNDEKIFKEIAHQWANSLILMKVLLDSKQIRFLAILQPNQYFSKKVLTAEEKKNGFYTK